MKTLRAVLPDTAQVGEAGRLTIGGCDAGELADRWGTPLLVLDQETIETRVDTYQRAAPGANLFYAGKAMLNVAICQLMDKLGVGLDVCSEGELRTALAAGFPPDRIILHGNNKSRAELELARDVNVGRIVVDSFDELARLEEIGGSSRLLVRVTPGVAAETHAYIRTGHDESKFGFFIADGSAAEAVMRAARLRGFELVGLHVHIGSQIQDARNVESAITRLVDFAQSLGKDYAPRLHELNVGGGLGIPYTRNDVLPNLDRSVRRITTSVREEFAKRGLQQPMISLEPGRSVIGSSGVTLYEIGTIKRLPGDQVVIAVDGGMSDNIRPSLYKAAFEALHASRPLADASSLCRIVGRHCESGDVLVHRALLPPDTRVGDILAIPATGAYTYALASNYNHQPKPAVVLVKHGNAQLIVARESQEDLYRLDRALDLEPGVRDQSSTASAGVP